VAEDLSRAVVRLEAQQSKTSEELGEMAIDLATLKADVAWLKRTYWVIAGASVGSMLAALFQLAYRAAQ